MIIGVTVSSLRQPPAALGEPATGSVDESGTGARLLLYDVRTAFLIANEARHLAIRRVFATTREQENLLTFVAALALADRLPSWLPRVPGRTIFVNAFLVAGVGREVLVRVAGPSASESPEMGNLLALALVRGPARSAVVKSLHGLRTGTHDMAVGFRHRYGYLVDPGHWRQRRALRRSRRTAVGARADPH